MKKFVWRFLFWTKNQKSIEMKGKQKSDNFERISFIFFLNDNSNKRLDSFKLVWESIPNSQKPFHEGRKRNVHSLF